MIQVSNMKENRRLKSKRIECKPLKGGLEASGRKQLRGQEKRPGVVDQLLR
jgi:hypothetical protein